MISLEVVDRARGEAGLVRPAQGRVEKRVLGTSQRWRPKPGTARPPSLSASGWAPRLSGTPDLSLSCPGIPKRATLLLSVSTGLPPPVPVTLFFLSSGDVGRGQVRPSIFRFFSFLKFMY